MTREQEAQIDALQAALETERHKLQTELHYIDRSLEHLRHTRHELRTGTPLTTWQRALRDEATQKGR